MAYGFGRDDQISFGISQHPLDAWDAGLKMFNHRRRERGCVKQRGT
jgi:hypothetical protein